MLCSFIEEDTLQVISDPHLPWAQMRGAVALIAGATGMIGFALSRTLRAASDRYGLGLKIFAVGRNNGRLDELIDNGSADCAFLMDIRKPLPMEILPEKIDYIFHCAAITESAKMVAAPVDVITTAVDGAKNLLEAARARGTKTFVFLSSMEVYGRAEQSEVSETDLGFIDLTNPRSSYPESKRCCESLCAAYSAQHKVPVKIARLAQTFGAGTQKNDTRVFAQFARSAMEGKDIILRTAGKSRGNYCYLSDTISGLLYILLVGNSPEIYNIANPQASATIREMAEIVAKDVCKGEIAVATSASGNVERRGYAPDAQHILNADKLKSLGWQPRYGLADMYRRMLACWQ